MEGNESDKDEKYETGSKEENLGISSLLVANDGHTQDNVISKNSDNQLVCLLNAVLFF